jgi:hypothetical protein
MYIFVTPRKLTQGTPSTVQNTLSFIVINNSYYKTDRLSYQSYWFLCNHARTYRADLNIIS